MSIPAAITTELQSLQAQVATAAPLNAASHATKTALKLNAGRLVSDVQAALVAPSTLDTWAAPVDPISIVAGVNAVVTVSEDQAALCLMRGVVGRVASNLDLLA